jgi:hypothetical protein
MVTEEKLAPYRSKSGLVKLTGSSGLPPSFFTPTDRAFRFDTAIITNPESPRDPRETLEIVLVLAFTGNVPVLRPGREWIALDHQCGGYSCQHELMIATPLVPRTSVLPALRLIAREGYFAETGHFDGHQTLASRIACYIAALTRIGVDCECTWRYLKESLYPIDSTQDNLNRIGEDAPDLESIADWNQFMRARYSNNPAIFFMTQNSD